MGLREKTLRNQISLGWVAMLLVMSIMMIIMIVESIFMRNDFRSLFEDPGRGGLAAMKYIISVYAVMPIVLHLIAITKIKALRWVAVIVGSLLTLFLILHHGSHWSGGQRPTLDSHLLDFAHHALGLWVIALSIRWARLDDSS